MRECSEAYFGSRWGGVLDVHSLVDSLVDSRFPSELDPVSQIENTKSVTPAHFTIDR